MFFSRKKTHTAMRIFWPCLLFFCIFLCIWDNCNETIDKILWTTAFIIDQHLKMMCFFRFASFTSLDENVTNKRSVAARWIFPNLVSLFIVTIWIKYNIVICQEHTSCSQILCSHIKIKKNYIVWHFSLRTHEFLSPAATHIANKNTYMIFANDFNKWWKHIIPSI